jgi:hypothetical protein
MAFLGASLDTLVNDLVESGHDFDLVKKSTLCKGDDSQSKLRLLLRKHAFPYEAVTSCKALEEMKSFPPRIRFFSKLRGENVTQEAYDAGKEAFEQLNCTSMIEYMEIYNLLDTLLLCECMNSFQHFIMDKFGLDCVQYISIPGLAFDACLLHTDIR